MIELKNGRIVKVAGPVVVAEEMTGAKMYDVVRVGQENLIGEIVELHGDRASIQVYEDTVGIGPGEKVVNTGAPLSVELGPGLISSIYDGIQRPLNVLYELQGDQILRGSAVPGLRRDVKNNIPVVASFCDDLRIGYISLNLVNSHFFEFGIIISRQASHMIASGQ